MEKIILKIKNKDSINPYINDKMHKLQRLKKKKNIHQNTQVLLMENLKDEQIFKQNLN